MCGVGVQVLWIGCADSRVPESVITASAPGEIFTHRNIANQFPANDMSAESVLEYAVGWLGVSHGAFWLFCPMATVSVSVSVSVSFLTRFE